MDIDGGCVGVSVYSHPDGFSGGFSGGLVDPVEPGGGVPLGGIVVSPELVPPEPGDDGSVEIGGIVSPDDVPPLGGGVPVPEPGTGVVVHAAIIASSPIAPSFRRYVII